MRTWTTGDPLTEDEVLVAPPRPPDGLEISGELARSPVAVAVWLERANVLASGCGGDPDLACVEAALGQQWSELGERVGGSSSSGWPTQRSPRPAWLRGAPWLGTGRPKGWRRACVLASDDGRLMADMVLFGPSRADASVTTGGHRLAARQCTGAGRPVGGHLPRPRPRGAS